MRAVTFFLLLFVASSCAGTKGYERIYIISEQKATVKEIKELGALPEKSEAATLLP